MQRHDVQIQITRVNPLGIPPGREITPWTVEPESVVLLMDGHEQWLENQYFEFTRGGEVVAAARSRRFYGGAAEWEEWLRNFPFPLPDTPKENPAMGRRRSTGEKPEKKTPVKIRLIPRKHAGKITEPWAIMERLVAECPEFEHVKAAKIKLWWQKDWKPDADNIATGAQVCKASEVDRNLVEESGGETPDVFIKLPEVQWPTLDDTEKEHRLFHELCHVKAAKDGNGKQKRDSKDRLLWRLGRHPIAAFHEEVARYGIERVIGHNGAVLDSLRLAERPMEKLFDKAEKTEKTSADNPATKADGSEAWKLHKLAVLKGKLTEKAFDALEGTHLGTLGELQAKMNAHGAFWAKEVGVHGRHAKAIEDAFNSYLISQQ